MSYAPSVDAACRYDSPEYPPSFDSWYLLEFQNETGYPCFIGINCPEPLPPVEYGSPYTATATVFSQLVTNYIALPNEWISTSGATVTGCQKDDFGVYYGCLYSGTKPWCTPETYPPYMNVVAVANMDLYQNNPSTPWATLNMIKGCFRSSGSGPWTCTEAYVDTKTYPAAPLGQCTSGAAMQ